MRIFVDTNVLISAFLTDGTCRSLISGLSKNQDHQLIIGLVVLEEARRVLDQKFAVPPQAIAQFEKSLCADSELQSTSADYDGPDISDADDVLVLANALAADADVLVTGDSDLLSVADDVGGLQITTPHALAEEVELQS